MNIPQKSAYITVVFRLGYRPELDGIRALAALAVLVYHSPGKYVHGWLGVDVFFVLSGFLITTLLVEEHEKNGRISFRGFWERRLRRLIPALILVLLAVIAAEFIVFGPAAYWPTAHAVRMILLYSVNWPLAWADQAIAAPLIHTWSLAVEEQFYLVVPVLVAGILSWRFGKRALIAVPLCGVLVVWFWRDYLQTGTQDFWSRIYYGTDTRADALLMGMCLAGLTTTGLLAAVPTWLRRGLALGGAAVLLAIVSGYWHPSVRGLAVYGLGLVAVSAFAVVGELVASPMSYVSRSLSVQPLEWLGKRSYGIYLWHMPVSAYVKQAELPAPNWALCLFVCAVTLGLAAVSYRYVEEPIRNAKRTPRPDTPSLVPAPVLG